MKHFWTGLGMLLVFLDAVFGAIWGRRCHFCERCTLTVHRGLCFSCQEMIQ